MAGKTQSHLPAEDDEVLESGSAGQAPEEEEDEEVVVIRPPSKTSMTFKSAINGKLPKDGYFLCGSHRPEPEGAWASNFWPSPFKDNAGNEWYTSEGYFQAGKAAQAKDWKMFDQIMAAKSPKTAKTLGRKVNLKGVDWDSVSWKYMLAAICMKFKRNPDLREKLLATGDKIIVEVQKDPVWGSNLTPSKTIKTEIRKWPGQNKLGELLMHYRKYLQFLESKGLDPATMPECPDKAEDIERYRQGRVSDKPLSDDNTAATVDANPDDNAAKNSEPEASAEPAQDILSALEQMLEAASLQLSQHDGPGRGPNESTTPEGAFTKPMSSRNLNNQAGLTDLDNSEIHKGKKRKANNSHEIELARKKRATEEL
ncbi:RIBX MIMIV N-glycosidase protein [Rutstroemia sp. NJR-2017a WRK4]|nr:RIBX MIMIV N-glycosidase protein [Rutstroemia sp. NJR-2017a WRK4]